MATGTHGLLANGAGPAGEGGPDGVNQPRLLRIADVDQVGRDDAVTGDDAVEQDFAHFASVHALHLGEEQPLLTDHDFPVVGLDGGPCPHSWHLPQQPADEPKEAERRRDASPGLRLAVHGRYNIYFRVIASETVIVRVLHSARDVRRLQFDDNGNP